jgi:hypothetical protein
VRNVNSDLKLARIFVTIILVSSLLAAIVPFNSAAAGNLCTMECCAGLAPHGAGSCHMKMSPGMLITGAASDHGATEHCGLGQQNEGAIKGIDAGVMGMNDGVNSPLNLDDVTIDASNHCNGDSHSEDVSAISHNDLQTASIEARTFSKPCPPECGTGVMGSGVRPSRDSLALAHGARPRPPTIGRERHFNRSLLATSSFGEQLRPRGPPLSFS